MSKPKIRFKGYEEDWEQRKLKNEAEFGKGNGYSKSDLTEFGTPIILYGRLYTKYENLISDVDTFVNTKDGSVYSEGGEVIVPASGETAIDIARAATVEKAGILLGGDLNIIKPNNNIDSKFLSLSISNGNSQRELAKKAQGKSVVHIHNKEIQDLIIPFPCIEEQKNISKYFFKLDRLITLHQRKCEETKKLKKYMLQKMFPQNRKRVPEIRFAGFTDDWEQRKFKNIASRESTTQTSSSEFPSVEYEDVLSEEGRLNKNIYLKKSEKMGIVFDGSQVLYGKLRPYLHNWLNPDFKGVAVGDWWVLKPIDTNKDFLYRLIQTQQFDNIANLSSGSKMPRADWNLVVGTEFMIPGSNKEQQKIGVYFSSLDHLITLHQRKYEELQKIKKFMLQNMFI